jgi:hypothetical protein
MLAALKMTEVALEDAACETSSCLPSVPAVWPAVQRHANAIHLDYRIRLQDDASIVLA